MASRSDHAKPATETAFEADDVIPIVLVAFALAVTAWLLPLAASLVHARAWPAMNAGEALAGSVRVVSKGHTANPRRAYPPRARATMPHGKSWWLAAGGPFALAALAGWAGWRRLEPLRARALLGRRDYDPRGGDPREWARPRDLRALVVNKRERDRFTIGRLDRRLVATDSEAHIAVVAPTRAGKTTRCVIPWLLEHDGPAIVTSTKRDVLDQTIGWRSKLGRVYVWDPGAPDCTAWTPLDGCEQWAFAVRQGAVARPRGRRGRSPRGALLGRRGREAPCPAAARRGPGRTRHGVRDRMARRAGRGGAGGDPRVPRRAAQRQLCAVLGLDPRNRGTTYMSAGSLLAAYRHPDVLASAHPGLRARDFLDGGAHTLYICAPARRQEELAPLVVALLSALLEETAARGPEQGPLSPTLRVLLDEVANIAPLRDLPQHLSQAAGHGVRIATIWQSVAQARERYGEGADSIFANSTAKLFMGPISDNVTRSHLEQLLGQELHERDEHESWRPKATAQALQQLGGDRALLVSGSLPPAVVRLKPFWESRDLTKRRVRG